MIQTLWMPMSKIIIVSLFVLTLTACSGSPLEIARGIFGYIPPPEETTIQQELKLEYDRCKKISVEKNCAQAAYDVVRVVKGLEPKKVPEGIVIILEGKGEHLDSDEEQDDEDPSESK